MTYRGLALSGRAGSGKSTLARLLVDELEMLGICGEVVSFGAALKQEVEELFGLTKDDPGGREKLVEWGEKRRNADPLHWVNAFAVTAQYTWRKGSVVICDDLRFISELGWCHQSGLDTVRLEVPTHVAAARITQPPDPLSPGEAELIPWSGWTLRYDDFDGSLRLPSVARQLAFHVRDSSRVVVAA